MIKLTSNRTGEPIFINPESIAFFKYDDYEHTTSITTTFGANFYVKESTEQVNDKIIESQTALKPKAESG